MAKIVFCNLITIFMDYRIPSLMDCGDCEISHNPDHTENPFWQKPNRRHNIPHLALAWRETTSCSEKKKNSSELHSKKKQNADWQSYELRTSTTRGPNWVTSYRATATELRAPNFQTGNPDRDTNYKAHKAERGMGKHRASVMGIVMDCILLNST